MFFGVVKVYMSTIMGRPEGYQIGYIVGRNIAVCIISVLGINFGVFIASKISTRRSVFLSNIVGRLLYSRHHRQA